MGSTLTVEEIYQYYHTSFIISKTGHPGRPITNWDKIRRTSESFSYIEMFTKIVNESNGEIDYKKYIDALFDFAKSSGTNWVNPKMFTSQKGIAIYNSYLQKLKDQNDPNYIKDRIIHSVQNVVRFCVKNNINSFENYIQHNAFLYPTLLRHLDEGFIKREFFIMIPNLKSVILSYAEDVSYDFFKNNDEDFNVSRSLQKRKSKWLNEFSKDMENIIDNLIKKMKNKTHQK